MNVARGECAKELRLLHMYNSFDIYLYNSSEVNISSYPATEVAGLFFFCGAEILNSGGFVQKYSDQGVSCKNIGQ